MKSACLSLFLTLSVSFFAFSQTNKVLFDASSAQMAGNADWVVDADLWNIGFNSAGLAIPGSGNESNPAGIPTPAQSGITSSTAETYWKGALSSFGVSLAKLGYTIETLPYNGLITFNNSSNPRDLSHYKVFVVDEPNIVFTSSEKDAIIQWVNAGGGLFMIADHASSDRNNDGWDAPEIWNDLMSNNGIASNPFGISFDSQNFSQITSNRANLPNNKILNGTQGSATQLQFSNGNTMTISTSENATVKGLFWKSGAALNSYNIMLAQANYGAGRVVALGDSSPVDDGTGDTNDQLYNGFTGEVSGNHKKMLLNAVIWLAGNAGTVNGNVDNRDAVETPFEYTLSVAPNPTTDLARVTLTSSTESKTLRIFSITGRQLFEQVLDGAAEQTEISLANWPTGMYLVSLQTKEEGVRVVKLMKSATGK
ncbi:MAG: T9SS type A sorting domain-containing protein [Bacteroidota bacterium]